MADILDVDAAGLRQVRIEHGQVHLPAHGIRERRRASGRAGLVALPVRGRPLVCVVGHDDGQVPGAGESLQVLHELGHDPRIVLVAGMELAEGVNRHQPGAIADVVQHGEAVALRVTAIQQHAELTRQRIDVQVLLQQGHQALVARVEQVSPGLGQQRLDRRVQAQVHQRCRFLGNDQHDLGWVGRRGSCVREEAAALSAPIQY